MGLREATYLQIFSVLPHDGRGKELRKKRESQAEQVAPENPVGAETRFDQRGLSCRRVPPRIREGGAKGEKETGRPRLKYELSPEFPQNPLSPGR